MRTSSILEATPARTHLAYGPQTPHVLALLEHGKTFDSAAFFLPTPKRVKTYRQLVQDWNAQQLAIATANRGAEVETLLNTIKNEGYDADARQFPPVVLWWTAGALLLRDVISPTCFTQRMYDELTREWRTKIGSIHPDDTDL